MKISLTATPEDISPESAEKQNGYADGFAEAVKIVLDRIPSSDPRDLAWGWGTVEVKVEFRVSGDKKVGYAYLGGCSYLNAEDFVKNSAYFQDMVNEAIAGAKPVKVCRFAFAEKRSSGAPCDPESEDF
jgi:hypothetical protein